MRVIFTPAAERQVDTLHYTITRDSGEQRADRYVARIVDFCNGLAVFPDRGMKREDLLPGLRVIGFARRVSVAFVVNVDAVIIEGIYYGGQDYEAALRE